MAGSGTSIDVLTLEEFNKTLTSRLSEAQALLTKLNTDLAGRAPALGTFVDGLSTARHYADIRRASVRRVERLIDAIVAVQTATGTILDNYRTTEARNHANAADIARVLGDVPAVLNGGPIDG
jgi:ABC-type transporter Mla subunit MlaD